MEAVISAIVQVVVLVMPALGLLLLALVTRATLKIQAGKQAVTAVELSPRAQLGALSSQEKLALAVDQLTSASTPLLTRMSSSEAVRIVEAVLPDVTRLSDASQLRPSDVKAEPPPLPPRRP